MTLACVLHRVPEDAEHTVLGTQGVPQQARGTGGLSGDAVERRVEGVGGPREASPALQAEVALPPAPFHSHKAGFVSIYLLDFSAKTLLEKHTALIQATCACPGQNLKGNVEA